MYRWCHLPTRSIKIRIMLVVEHRSREIREIRVLSCKALDLYRLEPFLENRIRANLIQVK